MINVVHINKKPYSFQFGMRMLWNISGKYDIEFDQIYDAMKKDYDVCLDVFVAANELAIKTEGEGNRITSVELEKAIDADVFNGDGKLLEKLFSAFNTQKTEEKGAGGKKKS